MRRLVFGISIAVIVLCAAATVSYVILDHFYGAEHVASSTRTILMIENSGQQVTVGSTAFNVENAEYMAGENVYKLHLSPASGYAEDYAEYPLGSATYHGTVGSVDVPSAAYEQAQETGNPVPVYETTTIETKPINTLPIAASIGIAMSLIVFGVWVGYRRMWGDATSTLFEHGLHDMTVRDVEIVGQMMELKEFTIPQLIKETRASKLTVWRTVQKLVEQGLVQPTDQTKLAANGLGGRGKPSRIYKYVGKQETE